MTSPAVSDSKGVFKIAVLGAQGVGKSTIIANFIDQFSGKVKVPIEFIEHSAMYWERPQGMTVHLFGCEHSACQKKGHPFSETDAFIFVWSVTNKWSMYTVALLMKVLTNSRSKHVPVIVVGNKSDVRPELRVTSKDNLHQYVKEEWNLSYMEASAKDNVNVSEILEDILSMQNEEQVFGIPSHPRTPFFLSRCCEKMERESCPIIICVKWCT